MAGLNTGLITYQDGGLFLTVLTSYRLKHAIDGILKKASL